MPKRTKVRMIKEESMRKALLTPTLEEFIALSVLEGLLREDWIQHVGTAECAVLERKGLYGV